LVLCITGSSDILQFGNQPVAQEFTSQTLNLIRCAIDPRPYASHLPRFFPKRVRHRCSHPRFELEAGQCLTQSSFSMLTSLVHVRRQNPVTTRRSGLCAWPAKAAADTTGQASFAIIDERTRPGGQGGPGQNEVHR
jgi:hypothetical protein